MIIYQRFLAENSVKSHSRSNIKFQLSQRKDFKLLIIYYFNLKLNF